MSKLNSGIHLHLLASALAIFLLSACGAVPTFNADKYVSPLSGATVINNTSNYTQALACLGSYLHNAKLAPVRIAVGRVEDFSGKQDLTNGKRITQGAALMVISALAHTKLPIVERLDTSISEMEFKYTDNKLIGDGNSTAEHPFRRTFAGSVVGSDFHIVGGITEVNYNIRSGSLENTITSLGVSARYAVLDVAIDLRLINTRTLQVVEVASFQKQIIGTEIRAGLFRFLSDSVIDISAADKAQEPIQKAVRMVTEHAVFHLIAGMYKIPTDVCQTGSSTNTESRNNKEQPSLNAASIRLPVIPAAIPAAIPEFNVKLKISDMLHSLDNASNIAFTD